MLILCRLLLLSMQHLLCKWVFIGALQLLLYLLYLLLLAVQRVIIIKGHYSLPISNDCGLVVQDGDQFPIRGFWIFRGNDIPPMMKEECYDLDLYNWSKVDIKDEVS